MRMDGPRLCSAPLRAALRPGHESGIWRTLSRHRHCDAPMHIPACSAVGWAKAHSAVPTNSIAVRGWWARCALPTLRYRVCGTQLSSQTHLRVLAADFARALLGLSTLQSKRAQGRPGAGSHPRSAARNAHAERTAQQHTGGADHSAFPARWSDGLCRDLPGADHSFWPPSPRELDDAVRPVGLARISAKGLTVATTARTTRFCRTHGPPFRRSFSWPRRRSRKLTDETKPSSAARRTKPRAHRDYPPCPRLSCRRCRVHRKPGSRRVTTHDRPSW
ncbi:hypothetical protein ABH975_002332 [Bradyrhizobium ottawaense]